MDEIVKFIVEHVDEGIIAADNNFNFILFNQAGEKILGKSAKHKTLKDTHEDWSDVYGCYYPNQKTKFKTDDLPLARACKGETVEATVIWIKNERIPDGLWIEAYAKPIIDENGKLNGGVVIFRDISKIYQIQRSMEQIKTRLEKINKNIGDSII